MMSEKVHFLTNTTPLIQKAGHGPACISSHSLSLHVCSFLPSSANSGAGFIVCLDKQCDQQKPIWYNNKYNRSPPPTSLSLHIFIQPTGQKLLCDTDLTVTVVANCCTKDEGKACGGGGKQNNTIRLWNTSSAGPLLVEISVYLCWKGEGVYSCCYCTTLGGYSLSRALSGGDIDSTSFKLRLSVFP